MKFMLLPKFHYIHIHCIRIQSQYSRCEPSKWHYQYNTVFVFSCYCILWESQPYYIDYINCYCGCIPIGLHFQSLKHSHLLLIVFQLSGILFEWILPSMSFSSKYFTVIRSHSIDGDWLVKCPQNRTIFFHTSSVYTESEMSFTPQTIESKHLFARKSSSTATINILICYFLTHVSSHRLNTDYWSLAVDSFQSSQRCSILCIKWAHKIWHRFEPFLSNRTNDDDDDDFSLFRFPTCRFVFSFVKLFCRLQYLW